MGFLFFLVCLNLVATSRAFLSGWRDGSASAGNLSPALGGRVRVPPSSRRLAVALSSYSAFEAREIRIVRVRVATDKLPPGTSRRPDRADFRPSPRAHPPERQVPAGREDHRRASARTSSSRRGTWWTARSITSRGWRRPSAGSARRWENSPSRGTTNITRVSRAPSRSRGVRFHAPQGRAVIAGGVGPGRRGGRSDAAGHASGQAPPGGEASRERRGRPVHDPAEAPSGDRPGLGRKVRPAAVGHAHQGQIFPFVLLVRLVYPLTAGNHAVPGGGTLHVSRGTGTWGPPMRFLAPPEITIIDLEGPP